ncbi:MAG TPA: hypothetical protein VFC19_35985 [Candidatus Limnocylindrales bacterium]|nr:hypothetical protein [Candidatus Limnocylindrales bacterium]
MDVGQPRDPLIHGRPYFARLVEVLRGTGEGDIVLFTDWRGDPDELLDGPGTAVADMLKAAAARGRKWRPANRRPPSPPQRRPHA